jgi:uncharacterized protein (TIGR03067 family)
MRLLSVVVVTVGLVVAAGASAQDAAKDEQKRLEGTWVVQSFTKAGKPADEMKGTELTFAGDTVTLRMKKDGEQKEMKAKYQIDPTKKPRTMDVQAEGKKDKMRGIYELKGDTLRFCHGVKEDERPTAFTDEGVVVVTLKRKKASE